MCSLWGGWWLVVVVGGAPQILFEGHVMLACLRGC